MRGEEANDERTEEWLVRWETNVPFQHKNRIYGDKDLGGDLVSRG